MDIDERLITRWMRAAERDITARTTATEGER